MIGWTSLDSLVLLDVFKIETLVPFNELSGSAMICSLIIWVHLRIWGQPQKMIKADGLSEFLSFSHGNWHLGCIPTIFRHTHMKFPKMNIYIYTHTGLTRFHGPPYLGGFDHCSFEICWLDLKKESWVIWMVNPCNPLCTRKPPIRPTLVPKGPLSPLGVPRPFAAEDGAHRVVVPAVIVQILPRTSILRFCDFWMSANFLAVGFKRPL